MKDKMSLEQWIDVCFEYLLNAELTEKQRKALVREMKRGWATYKRG